MGGSRPVMGAPIVARGEKDIQMQICPLMSYAANQVPCVREQCAFWDTREEVCAHLAGPRRIEDAVERMISTLNEIKVKF